jgi:hypothetical protein
MAGFPMNIFFKSIVAGLLATSALSAQPAFAQSDAEKVEALQAEVAALKEQIAALHPRQLLSQLLSLRKKPDPKSPSKAHRKLKAQMAGVSSRAGASIMTQAISVSRVRWPILVTLGSTAASAAFVWVQKAPCPAGSAIK